MTVRALELGAFDFGEALPSQTLNVGVPLVSTLRPGNDGSPDSEKNSGFRSPGDSATLPELIRFIIDRTGYIKALRPRARPKLSAALRT